MLGFYDVVLGFDDVVLGFYDVVLGFDDVVLCFDDVMRSRHDMCYWSRAIDTKTNTSGKLDDLQCAERKGGLRWGDLEGRHGALRAACSQES